MKTFFGAIKQKKQNIQNSTERLTDKIDRDDNVFGAIKHDSKLNSFDKGDRCE